MLNHKQTRGLKESVITLSHEVAHNFNASHDDAFEDNDECYDKGFIMDELQKDALQKAFIEGTLFMFYN